MNHPPAAGPAKQRMCFHAPWWDDLLHHFLVAATIGIVTLVLDVTGKLEWLDATMLRVAGSRGEIPSLPLSKLEHEITHMPSVVLIDEKAYEQGFNQVSPLDRTALAHVIALVVARNPRMLVIDIDMSPSYAERNALADRAIDRALIDAAKKIPLILAVPSPTATLKENSFRWVQKMCRNNIAFGTVGIRQHLGTVVRYDTNALSLGTVAFASEEQRFLAAAGNEKAAETGEADREKSICGQALRPGTAEEFFASLIPRRHVEKIKLRPIQPDVLSLLPSFTAFVRGASDALTIESPERIIPHSAVFVGGSFVSSDRFWTAAGESSGANLHAAVYASAKRDTQDATHPVALVIDIVIGVLLGYVFHCLWSWYRNGNKGVAERAFESFPEFARLARKYVWLVGIWAVPILIAWWMALVAGWFLANDLWLNPGPIILGMFLHTLITNETDEPSDSSNVQSLKDFIVEHPASVFMTLIIVSGALYAFTHH